MDTFWENILGAKKYPQAHVFQFNANNTENDDTSLRLWNLPTIELTMPLACWKTCFFGEIGCNACAYNEGNQIEVISGLSRIRCNVKFAIMRIPHSRQIWSMNDAENKDSQTEIENDLPG